MDSVGGHWCTVKGIASNILSGCQVKLASS